MSGIKVHNDGKEKYMSFEAHYDEGGVGITGYGSTKDEAIAELKKEAARVQKMLNSIDYEDITMVDWRGQPIKSGAV